MPTQPGESLLVTLFADVHYYFGEPTAKPQHHRFAKASYLYLYHNSVANKAKVEVANHAGTPEQDAFHGYLDAASSIRYSHKQPSLFTIMLHRPAIASQAEWHIPSYNERNEQKYLYTIHSIDVYLWTEKDAVTLLRHLRSVVSADKLDIRDTPQADLAEHRSSMSPVVQQLERTAIGQHFPPRAESTASAHSLPGPPTPSTAATASPAPQHAQAPAPMAYNPAAPAAPETIAHREKTPPPTDDGSASGLSSVGRYDNHPQVQYAAVPQNYQSSLQSTPQASYFPGPPQLQQQRRPSSGSIPTMPQHGSPGSMHRTTTGGLPPPPPMPAGGPSPANSFGPSPAQQTPSFAPPPAGVPLPLSPPATQQSFNRQSSFGMPQQQLASYPTQPQTQYANYAPSPGFAGPPSAFGQPPTPSAPPAYSNNTPLQSPGFPPQQQAHTPSVHQQAAQIGGYSAYNYIAHQQPGAGAYNPQGAYGGDMHNQLYRPTADEAAHGAKPHVQVLGQRQQQGEQKTGQRLDRIDKGVSKFLKKLDSKW